MIFYIFKLESLSNEELIKLVKTHMILKKKFETKINELTNSHTSLNQIEVIKSIDWFYITEISFFFKGAS